jgi:hypothetical protein
LFLWEHRYGITDSFKEPIGDLELLFERGFVIGRLVSFLVRDQKISLLHPHGSKGRISILKAELINDVDQIIAFVFSL